MKMAPVPHPIHRIQAYLRERKFPKAKYVSQPASTSPIMVGFDPGLTLAQKSLLKLALGQCKASSDGKLVRIDQPELRRREHKKFTLDEIVEIFQPRYGTGTLVFSYDQSSDNYEQTTATLRLKRGVNRHIDTYLPNVERFIQSIPHLGEPKIKTIDNTTLAITFLGSFPNTDFLKWLEEQLSNAARIYFETDPEDIVKA